MNFNSWAPNWQCPNFTINNFTLQHKYFHYVLFRCLQHVQYCTDKINGTDSTQVSSKFSLICDLSRTIKNLLPLKKKNENKEAVILFSSLTMLLSARFRALASCCNDSLEVSSRSVVYPLWTYFASDRKKPYYYISIKMSVGLAQFFFREYSY